MNLAQLIDAIPVVQSTADRGARFQTPTTDQRVFNKGTGNFERWSGAAWVIDLKTYIADPDGNLNVAIGYQALNANLTGTQSVAVGYQALLSADVFTANVAIGYQAMKFSTTGYNNTAVGWQALAVNNLGGFNNTAVGYQALTSNTSGNGNTALGVTAMVLNTTGVNNTALGIDALYTNTSGSNNTAVGSNAIGFGSGGGSNVAVGWRALFVGGATSTNVAVGLQTLTALTAGDNNCAIGTTALLSLTGGAKNTAIGTNALGNNLTGSNNTALGYLAGLYETGSNAFYVNGRIDWANTAAEKAGSLLYGTFGVSAATNTLAINAALTVPVSLVVGAVDPGGTNPFRVGGSIRAKDASGSIDLGGDESGVLRIARNNAGSGKFNFLDDANNFAPVQVGTVLVGTDPGGTDLVRIGGGITINVASPMIRTKTSFTNNAAAQAGTLTNAPLAGNPTKWIPIDDNGVTRNIPAW